MATALNTTTLTNAIGRSATVFQVGSTANMTAPTANVNQQIYVVGPGSQMGELMTVIGIPVSGQVQVARLDKYKSHWPAGSTIFIGPAPVAGNPGGEILGGGQGGFCGFDPSGANTSGVTANSAQIIYTPWINVDNGNQWQWNNALNCWQPLLASPVVNLLQTVEIPLTLAQLQALNTSPVSVIPAFGAGSLTTVVSATLNLIYGSASFSGGGTVQLSYGAATTYPASATWAASDFTSLSANQVHTVAGALAVTASTNVLNKAIYLFGNSANFSSGTGGSAILTVAYYINAGLS